MGFRVDSEMARLEGEVKVRSLITYHYDGMKAGSLFNFAEYE